MSENQIPDSLPPVPSVPSAPERNADYNPYSPPEAMVADMAGIDLDELPLATRGSRWMARILDGLLAFLIALPLGYLVPDEGADASLGAMSWALVGLLLGLVGVQIFFLVRDGQTLGKKAMRIKIVRLDNSRVAGGRLLLVREMLFAILSVVPIFGIFARLADILFIFGKDQRCLHDYIADTKVVIA